MTSPTPSRDSEMFGILAKLQNGSVSVEAIAQQTISHLEEVNPKINAFVSHNSQTTLKSAIELDCTDAAKRAALPLFGIPISIKDNICTMDFPTTCGSRILKNFHSHYDATVVRRLRAAGAIILGKTNCDEFAMGSSTESSMHGPTRNPWNLARVPGGTSGGSAAAVAARIGYASIGSDTGGSVRQPAGFCGVVGFKPTYGSVSRFGLIAHGSSLDQIGILSRKVDETAHIFNIISGQDPHDMTSSNTERGERRCELSSLRIASLGSERLSCQPEVTQAYKESQQFFRSEAKEFREIELGFLDIAVPLYYIISTAEAASNLSRYDGIRYGEIAVDQSTDDILASVRTSNLGQETKRRILLGTFVLSEGYSEQYYAKAKKIRSWLIEEFRILFNKFDLLVLPTSPTTAFEAGSKLQDPIQMYQSDIFTTLANLIGTPAISMPAGFDSDGLPIGIQMMSKWGSESILLAAAEKFERQNPWYERRQPKLH